jgi:hypothetical protein
MDSIEIKSVILARAGIHTWSMRIVDFSDARNSLRAVLDQVAEDGDLIIFSCRCHY